MDETPEAYTDAELASLLDQRYADLIRGSLLDAQPELLVSAVTFDGIRPVVESADRNFARLFCLMTLPAHLWDMGEDWCLARHEAASELEAEREDGDGSEDLGRDELAGRLNERASEIMAEKYLGGEDMEEQTREERHAELDIAAHNVTQATGALQAFAVSEAMYALYSAILIQAWTIFEALAKDLWVAALNHRPRLGLEAINANVTEQDTEQQKEDKRKKTFQVPSQIARDPKFVLHESLGTLLKEKWKFSKRESAADAYFKVFGKNQSAVRDVFYADDIRWLCAIRNVFVHKAGIVDEEFRGGVANHPDLSQMNNDEQVGLRGDLVSNLLNAAHARCRDLIAFVNDWMESNPT